MSVEYFAARGDTIRNLPGLGIAVMRAPTLAVERVLWSYYDDPLGDANEYVDALVSHTLDAPRLSYDDVRALSLESRDMLRSAVVELCGLAPDAGASDDALLAAMRDRRDRLAHNASTSVARWVREMADGLRHRAHAAARGPDLTPLVRRIEEFGENLRAVVDFCEAQPLAFVVGHTLADTSFDLLFDAFEQGDDVVARLLRVAVVNDAGFLANVDTAVAHSAALAAGQKDEIKLGLEALSAARNAPACRLLMGALEGALWSAGRRENVVDNKRQLTKSLRVGRPSPLHATSINRLFDEKYGLDLPADLRLYLHSQLYDGHGHDLRHGWTNERADEYAEWALMALCGWLDRCDGTNLMSEVGERIDGALAPTPAP